MKILIYTTHRTGSTSLANYLMIHYDCDYYRESYFKNGKMVEVLNKNKNAIVKFTPLEVDYQSVRHLFDKCIILYRDNIIEQAESWLYADKVKKHFEPYTIDDKFLKENKEEIDSKIQTIKNENEKLKSCDNALHITYEELYYSTKGIVEIENYLGTKFSFKMDSKKKYRDTKKTLL
jgi:hypothetical protein